MTQPRQDYETRDLAEFAIKLIDSRTLQPNDVHELNDRAKAIIAKTPDKTTDFASLAARYDDDQYPRTELELSAREVLQLPRHPMDHRKRIALGVYMAVLGAIALAIVPWAWSLATRMVAGAAAGKSAGTSKAAHFLWFTFTPSADFTLLIVVMVMALVGSVAVSLLTFGNRAGHKTLEDGFTWWYMTRPITAVGIGVLFYMTVVAGFFNQSAADGRTALAVAAAVGGLAGLFTDQVLQKMRGVLGQTRFDEASSDAGEKASGQG